MPHPLEQQLLAGWPAADWSAVTVLLGVSGGPDSVALLRATVASRVTGPGRLVVAHFHHRTRGPESDADECFVRQLADRWGVSYVTNGPGPAERATSEAELRRARYAYLREVACHIGARYLATGHTADDQAETILMRVLRGTGLRGLAGIPAAREWLPGIALVRPLLNTDRATVLDYLHGLSQDFRVDGSNTQRRWTRNQVRQDLLPWLARDYNPLVREALCRLGRLAGEAEAALDSAANELRQQAVLRATAEGAEIDCEALRGAAEIVVRQLFRQHWRDHDWKQVAMSDTHWRELARLAAPAASDQELHLPGGISAARRGMTLHLQSPPRSSAPEHAFEPEEYDPDASLGT